MHKKFIQVFSNFWGFKIGIDAKNCLSFKSGSSYLHNNTASENLYSGTT